MIYEDALSFLFSHHSSEFHDLQRIRYLLHCLNDPQESFPAVLIAGTNGKGSTAKMLSAALQVAGYRVGCFTSPHLLDFGERITVNGVLMSHETTVALTEEIREGPLETFRDEQQAQLGKVSFFEIVTTMALVYFARQQVDIAILEVGIGGRLDATNAVNPLVSIITNVGLDHQKFLGNTIASIAREKSGIIRSHGEVVTGSQHADALQVLEAVCAERQATCYRTGILDRSLGTNDAWIVPQKVTSTGSFFSYRGLLGTLEDLYLRLPGIHQLANAATALCAMELLQRKDFSLPENAIRSGLGNVRHPGRLEILHSVPLCVVDIAHNAMAARTIAQALPMLFEYEHVIVVIGILHDKDVREILRPFLSIADSIIFTHPSFTERAETAATLARIAGQLVHNVFAKSQEHYQHWDVCESVERALLKAHDIAGPRDLVCITGSNYLVSEAEMFYASRTSRSEAREPDDREQKSTKNVAK